MPATTHGTQPWRTRALAEEMTQANYTALEAIAEYEGLASTLNALARIVRANAERCDDSNMSHHAAWHYETARAIERIVFDATR